MVKNIRLGNITIDCKDAIALRNFYSELLGWEACTIGGFPVTRDENGMMLLFNEADFICEKPVWPEEPGKQQKQMHFDFHVDDLASAVLEAEKLGAVKSPLQYGGHHYTTMFDPEGHPFCLCAKEKPIIFR